MALIAPQTASVTGLDTSYAAIAASDTFKPEERGVLHYRAAGTASTLTIVCEGNNDVGQPNPDITVALTATDDKHITTAQLIKYASPSTGLITVTSSSQTSVTVAYVLI